MEKFRFGLFDVFVYTLPGILVLSALCLFCTDLTIGVVPFIEKIISSIGGFSINFILLILFVSYLLGYVLHYFGYNYFVFVGKRIWKKKLAGREHSFSLVEQKYVLVRHYSKENFVYVELWNTFRGMSFNLSLAFLIIAFVLFIKIIDNLSFKSDWALVLTGFIGMSVVTLRRAVTFHVWGHNTLDETVNTLNLLNKRDSEANTSQISNSE